MLPANGGTMTIIQHHIFLNYYPDVVNIIYLNGGDHELFIQNENDCCRIAAIYAFYLMSHREDGKYFVANMMLMQRI